MLIPLSIYLMLAGQIQLFVAVRGLLDSFLGNEAQTYTIMVTYKAPPLSWAVWGLALVPLLAFQVATSMLAWRILRVRDYSEVENLKSDAQIVSFADKGALFRGTGSASRARKLGLSLILTAILSLSLMCVGILRFNWRQSLLLTSASDNTSTLGATVSAILTERLVEAFLSDLLVPFCIVFVTIYGIYYIGWHHYQFAASYLFVGMGYAHSVILVVLLLYYIFSTINLEFYKPGLLTGGFPVQVLYVAGVAYILTTLSLSVITILAHRFLRTTRKVLAVEITDVVYRRLEDVFGQ